jgi:predicted secreted Zn-dependent protease
MRKLAIAAAMIAVGGLSVQAEASEIKIKTDVNTYPIAGRSGAELLMQMDRKGPKHGFLTRAIAQTRYEVTWNIDWEATKGICRVAKVEVALDIDYRYPRVTSKMTPALRKRWEAFLRGVRKHEETHGAIARKMVSAAEKSVSSVAVKNDSGCRAAKAEVKKRVSAAYVKYEAEQRRFDTVEHRNKGNVARLVERLMQ